MGHHKYSAWRLFPVILIAGLLFLLTDSRAVAGKIRVACVGDSITYGAGVPQRHTQGWPGELQQLLGTGYQVANFGHSGATMLKNGGLPYWKTPEFDILLALSLRLPISRSGRTRIPFCQQRPYFSHFDCLIPFGFRQLSGLRWRTDYPGVPRR